MLSRPGPAHRAGAVGARRHPYQDRSVVRSYRRSWPYVMEPMDVRSRGRRGNASLARTSVHRRKVDAVALPIDIPGQLTPLPYVLDAPSGQSMILRAEVSEWVNIIGFPFGESSAGYFAIWVKGAIASDIEIDHDQLPCFLIDSRTRAGQSGSPVVAYAPPGPAILSNGTLALQETSIVRLLGVYSGRINRESDIGYVWKVAAIIEILENGVTGDVSIH